MIPDPHSQDSIQSTDSAASSSWPPAADGSSSTSGVASVQQRAAQIANERPETAVGAAFAGGFLLAMILRRLAR